MAKGTEVNLSWIAASDVGNIRTKIYADFIGPDSGVGAVVLDSICAPLSANTGEAYPAPGEAIAVDDDAEYWVFGHRLAELADTSRLATYTNETRYWSPWYIRFVLLPLLWGAMCHEYTKEAHVPRVLLSLPASVYTDEKKLALVKEALYGKNGIHTVYAFGEKRPYKFVLDPNGGNVVIRAEGTGSFYRALVNELDYQSIGQTQNVMPPTTDVLEQSVMVGAWGWLTFSVIGFRKGVPIQGLGKSNPYVGMSQLGLRLLPYIGNPSSPSPAQVNEWLMSPSDTIEVNGHKYPGMVEVRRTLAIELANDGLNWMMGEKNATRLDFGRLMITGGTGAFLFGEPGPRVRMHDLTSQAMIPGGRVILSPDAPTDDAYGLWLKWDANRRYGV